jgi:Zn-dependent peptidase ImmA (M78 family)/DNA-binding XRE family transcriptional regulator
MSALESQNPQEVGERLRLARESANITQKEAAEKLNIARTTLVAIEKGERRIRLSELQDLAKIYGTNVNALMRSESQHVDLIPRFRKFISATDRAADDAALILSNLAKAEVELENLLGVKRSKNYPPERPILPGDVREQAEQDALELRQRLGLGSSPITDIFTLLELELDVRVYVRRLDSRISGLFAFDEQIGACILLNANHPLERRTLSAAHECGHFISTRRQPEVLHLNEVVNSREEKYADAFSRAFLAPARAIKQKFLDVMAGSNRFTRRHVIILAHFFGISRHALVLRLEELGILKPGTWDWFESNGKITNEQARQVLGELEYSEKRNQNLIQHNGVRLYLLAEQAYHRNLLSEGQLARMLCMERTELRDILLKSEIGENEADGVPNHLV